MNRLFREIQNLALHTRWFQDSHPHHAHPALRLAGEGRELYWSVVGRGAVESCAWEDRESPGGWHQEVADRTVDCNGAPEAGLLERGAVREGRCLSRGGARREKRGQWVTPEIAHQALDGDKALEWRNCKCDLHSMQPSTPPDQASETQGLLLGWLLGLEGVGGIRILIRCRWEC